MGYALRPGLFFCSVDGQDIFLDVPADRYFRLSAEPEAAFRRLQEEGSVPPSELVGLDALGLVEEVSASGGLLPPYLDMAAARSPAMSRSGLAIMPALSALFAQLSMERHLRARGLEATIARLRRDKERCPAVAQGGEVFERWIHGFEVAKLLRSPADRCLPRSLALATCLLRAGHEVQLVIGVQLRPFLAHCWVQQGTIVLNDTPEDVAAFTPILVI